MKWIFIRIIILDGISPFHGKLLHEKYFMTIYRTVRENLQLTKYNKRFIYFMTRDEFYYSRRLLSILCVSIKCMNF